MNAMNQEKIKELEKTIQQEYSNITGIVVQKNGVKLYESYFQGYTARNAVHVYSVTKSVFSALLGIAFEKGFLKSVDQKVLDFFPDYTVPEGEKTIQKITIRHLLTMTAPYKYETEPYLKFFTSENPIYDALDLLGGDKPIGTFHYSSIGGTHILAGILAKAIDRPILAFAMENLFLPLGIQVTHNVTLHDEQEHIAVMNDKNSTGWVVDPQGNNMASWGLFLTPLEMAKIGQLYLNGGKWGGKQIVPAGWIQECTTVHSQWNDLLYGYLWWIMDEKTRTCAAMGDGGNVIYVNTEKKMVVSIASLFLPDNPQTDDRIAFITDCIEPLFEDDIL